MTPTKNSLKKTLFRTISVQKKEFTDITQQVIAKENVPEKNTKQL